MDPRLFCGIFDDFLCRVFRRGRSGLLGADTLEILLYSNAETENRKRKAMNVLKQMEFRSRICYIIAY